MVPGGLMEKNINIHYLKGLAPLDVWDFAIRALNGNKRERVYEHENLTDY